MNCEIEFLAVGEGSKPGDAIVVRYGTEQDFRLMLVDGGHAETGDRIVAHLKKHFGPRPVLEHVLLTHPDLDHASGLRNVFKEVTVKNLWMHVPWIEAQPALFADKRWTADGLRQRIENEYDVLAEIFDLADQAGCSIYQPFAGHDIGPFRILSPSHLHYRLLVPQFDRTPAADEEVIRAAGLWIGKGSLIAKAFDAARSAVQRWTTETWERERLRDGGVTSPNNESSVVLYGDFGDDRRVLLTGDAGLNAFRWAADEADSMGLPLRRFSFVQVPHHGSRRNVGPTILDRLLGDRVAEGTPSTFSAYVSSPRVEDSHPRLIVLNAFTRRGGTVVKTNGSGKIHYGGFARRQGYSSARAVPFSTHVEEYD